MSRTVSIPARALASETRAVRAEPRSREGVLVPARFFAPFAPFEPFAPY